MFPFFKNKKEESIPEKKYDIHTVEYIIHKVLQETVDRKVLEEVLNVDLEPIIGKAVVEAVFAKLNRQDLKFDKKSIKKWLYLLDKEEF